MSSKKFTVTDSATGNKMTIDPATYEGDLPESFGHENDGENVTWVNYDYAARDPAWGVEGVPVDQPVWEAH